jgi:hypothetical protein
LAPSTDVAARKRFVLDVVQSSLALPQADQQDRLRVLVSAARLASVVSPNLARSLGTEGVEIERQMLAAGQQPSVSMLQLGLADCRTSANFIDSLPVEALHSAEPSVIGLVQKCSRTVLPTVRRKLEEAQRQGIVVPRAMLATMEATGLKSAWSQQQYESVFSALPDPQHYSAEAVNYAAIYQRVTEAADRDTARDSGLKLITWLARLEPGPERSEALNSVTAAMQKALGEEKYREALRSDVMASQAAQNAGQAFELPPPDEGKTVSVLRAMNNREDQTDALQQMGPAQKARQAAAYGFAAAHSGDDSASARYFDTAFAALEDAWALRGPRLNAVAVVEEVSGAAAHADPIAALARAQRLQDPAARAISMLAVAQVVLARQDSRPPAVAHTTSAAR